MSDLTRITPESTIGDLPLCDFQVSPATLGLAIAYQFSQRSDLPGTIIADRSQLLGMISRRKFQEIMSQPDSREQFLQSPIQSFLQNKRARFRFLQFPSTEKIEVAARLALSRSADAIYDPLVVVFTDEDLPNFNAFFLLDCQALFIAQSQVLSAVSLEIHNQRTRTRNYIRRLEQEQRKVQEYAKLLESQKTVIQERNLLLETQQIELLEQARDISKFNKRFIKIGKLLSSEGKKAFQATFSGVTAICQNTTQIVNIGRLLSNELKTIRDTSKLIEEVSQQVQHLAVQAAIVANREGTEMGGFSQVTAEIGKLVGQTFEAAGRTHRVSARFRVRLEELTDSAREGTVVARSLVEKIEQAQNALAELEELVQLEKAVLVRAPDDDRATLIEKPESPQVLVQKIARAESTLSELKELVKYKDSGSLIEKIRRTLDLHKKEALPRSPT